MSKVTNQKVSTVDGREVKFFETRKEAREYNRKNGTVWVEDNWYYWCIAKQTVADVGKRWFVFLDTKPSSKVSCPLVDGKPVVFFKTRSEARRYKWFNHWTVSVPKDLWTKVYNNAGYANIYNAVGNVNNYRWFVFL